MSGAHIRANEVQKTTEPVRQPGQELIRQQEQGSVQAVTPQAAYRRVQLNRDGLRPADLLALQRAVGNRTVQRMLAKANDEQQDETAKEDSERTVQTKLTVGAPKDVYEQETDRVAGRVMTMPDAATQRPNRTGLPDGLKSGVESLSGISLDNVNVHYYSSQPAQLNALAYTQGSDIHVAPGQEQHLPHEAWHVVQQAQGRVQPTMQMKDGVPVNDDEGLEHEADVMGTKALAPDGQLKGGHEEEELLQGKFAPMQRMGPEQGGAMAHTTKSQSDQHRGYPAAQRLAASGAAATVVDQRPAEVAQRELADAVSIRPRVIVQPASRRAVLSGPRVVAKVRRLEGLFGNDAQLRSDPANAFYRLLSQESSHEVSPIGFADAHGRPGNQVVQRSFQHKGKKKKAETCGPKSVVLPTIHGVSAVNLKALADDQHDYGVIENKQGFDLAWAVYQQRHQRQAEVVPLDQEQVGNVTVLDEEEVGQVLFPGTVRMTFQLDWLQGKHDTPFMQANSTVTPRTMQDTQMRLSLDQYSRLAGVVPMALAMAQLGAIFAKQERTPLNFSVMGAKQADDLYYEISAVWATTGPAERHVLVYYHCFPDKKDQKNFGM